MKKHAIYYFSAFISGLSVMAVEMSATRLLAPYVGSSIFVWTNIIGLVMLALSLGYFLGGKLADKNPKAKPYFSIILLTGLWVVLLPFVSGIIFQSLIEIFPDVASLMLWGSFISVFLLLVVPMTLLGMIVPFTVKLVTANLKDLGSAAGKVSAVSTFGSILGTFLPAFFFIPVFGTTKTFIILGVLLITVAAFGLKKWFLYLLAALAFILIWFVPPVFAVGNIIHSEDSPYQHIFVSEGEGGVRNLFINNQFGLQSKYDPNQVLVPGYYSYFSVIPAMLEEPKNILILGHAGGTLSRIFNEYYPEMKVTGVELDPQVTKVAKNYLYLDESKVTIVHGDARTFLQTNNEEFDVIILDAYNVISIPSHLATAEFFELAKRNLSDQGILGLNAVSWEGDFIDTMANTLSSVFSNVIKVRVTTSVNSVLFAGDVQDFEIESVHEDIAQYKRYISGFHSKVNFDPQKDVFTDDKSSLVEVKTQGMILDVFSRF